MKYVNGLHRDLHAISGVVDLGGGVHREPGPGIHLPVQIHGLVQDVAFHKVDPEHAGKVIGLDLQAVQIVLLGLLFRTVDQFQKVRVILAEIIAVQDALDVLRGDLGVDAAAAAGRQGQGQGGRQGRGTARVQMCLMGSRSLSLLFSVSEPPRSGGSGAHVNDDLREDLAGGEQILNAGVLVGTVHVAVEAGHAAAEGHAAGDIMDVGAAADGQALARAPGIRLITAQQRLHEGRIGVGMVRGVHARPPR